MKVIQVIMYGKKPIAAFHRKDNAQKALLSLKNILPAGYLVRPHIVKVPIQG